MSAKAFGVILSIILIFGFLLRIFPLQNNNLFFTADQGRDAVNVREIVERGQIIKKGPVTGINGIHTGPGWYYFLAIGHKLFNGNPVGGVLMVIVLSLLTTLILGLYFRSLVLIFSLQFFWFFYDTSRWAFNPFPLVILSIILILLLSKFLVTKSKKFYWLSLIPIFLAYNTEIAGATALLILFLVTGFFVFRKNYKLQLASAFTSVAFLQPNFTNMFSEFLQIIANSTIPQNVILGCLLFAVIIFCYQKSQDNNLKRKYFINLTLGLLVISYLFFSWNKGWRDWNTVYLPTLLFTSVFLMLQSFKKKIVFGVWIIIMIAQIAVFIPRYQEYLKPSDDPGILSNQMQVLNWIYSHNENDGFNVYTQMQTEFDYPYQYLFWWYGKGAYGFVPCQYADFPRITLKLYVPGELNYQSPQLGCNKFRFLIIEDDAHPTSEKEWQALYQKTTLVEETRIGQIRVEKRKVFAN